MKTVFLPLNVGLASCDLPFARGKLANTMQRFEKSLCVEVCLVTASGVLLAGGQIWVFLRKDEARARELRYPRLGAATSRKVGETVWESSPR